MFLIIISEPTPIMVPTNLPVNEFFERCKAFVAVITPTPYTPLYSHSSPSSNPHIPHSSHSSLTYLTLTQSSLSLISQQELNIAISAGYDTCSKFVLVRELMLCALRVYCFLHLHLSPLLMHLCRHFAR